MKNLLLFVAPAMKHALLLLILLPVLSFGQSRKKLKERIYWMQVDSAYQQGLLLKAKQENIQLNDRINGLNNELNSTKSLLEVEEESNLILQMDINALREELQKAQDQIEALENELALYANINQCAYFKSLPQRDIDLLVETKIENQYFRTRQDCEEAPYETFRYTGSEIYINGSSTGGKEWGIDYDVECRPKAFNRASDEPVIEFAWGYPNGNLSFDYRINGGFFINRTNQCKYFPEGDILIEDPFIEDNIVVDVPMQKACFKDSASNCESLSDSEQDQCCQKAILTYLAKVPYPTQAKDLGVEGKVLLRFVVEKDGSISQIEKVRGDDMLADAAIRHIKNSGGKWIPGTNNGETVRSRFVAPFTFKLR